MRQSIVYGALCALGLMVAAVPVKAVSVTTVPMVTIFDPGMNGGIGSISVDFINGDANTDPIIRVSETWISDAAGFLQISGLEAEVNYVLEKIITNSSNVDFTSITNELLDPSGDNNDSDDMSPPPTFVPTGFSPSNETDGLSFAQGVTTPQVPRDGGIFGTIVADELAGRDFLDFSGASLKPGETTTLSYGLRDNLGSLAGNCTQTGCPNDFFLLSQRPNEISVPIPAPGTLLIFGLGLAGIGALRRRKAA
jgi:PEP-CTERM motif